MTDQELRLKVDEAVWLFLYGEGTRETIELNLDTGAITRRFNSDPKNPVRELVFTGAAPGQTGGGRVIVMNRDAVSGPFKVLFDPSLQVKNQLRWFENRRIPGAWQDAYEYALSSLNEKFFPCRGGQGRARNDYSISNYWKQRVRSNSCGRCPYQLACVTANWEGMWFYDEANHKPSRLEEMLQQSMQKVDKLD